MRVGIIDYGLGNLASVLGAMERLGTEAYVCSTPEGLAGADKLILPGVGAFGDGIANLRERGLIEPLRRHVLEEGHPLLGICLGYQLLARDSDEHGHHEGLGWIDAVVRRLRPEPATLRVPHVGWNDLIVVRESLLFTHTQEKPLAYFVHSYAFADVEPGIATAECDYGGRFVAAVQKGPVYGVQFHPEKSQKDGLAILSAFLELA